MFADGWKSTVTVQWEQYHRFRLFILAPIVLNKTFMEKNKKNTSRSMLAGWFLLFYDIIFLANVIINKKIK